MTFDNYSSVERFHTAAEKVLNTLRVQIYPSSECVELNDKFTKKLFNQSEAAFQKMLGGSSRGLIEKKNSNNKDKTSTQVITRYSVKNSDGYDDTEPLTEFERAVLGVIISEIMVGNRYTTINIIFRALIGKVGEVGITPYPNQKSAIIHAIKKLRSTLVDFSNVKDSLVALHYISPNGDELSFGEENLLSAGIVSAKINGQEMNGVIYFKDDSPLLLIADAKNQIVRYPAKLLDVPNQNNTPLIITLKKYVMRRISEIKLHKQLVPTITFDDVFKKCRIENENRRVKFNARTEILKLFQHLQDLNFILSFELIKKGTSIYSVKFNF